ncbi:MAG: hypothetical protein RPU13_07575 [Candidatus Sedimenticola sp. (ex Thyasira tokunagai)]
MMMRKALGLGIRKALATGPGSPPPAQIRNYLTFGGSNYCVADITPPPAVAFSTQFSSTSTVVDARIIAFINASQISSKIAIGSGTSDPSKLRIFYGSLAGGTGSATSLTGNLNDGKLHTVSGVITFGTSIEWEIDGIAQPTITGINVPTAAEIDAVSVGAFFRSTGALSFYTGVVANVDIRDNSDDSPVVGWDIGNGSTLRELPVGETSSWPVVDKSDVLGWTPSNTDITVTEQPSGNIRITKNVDGGYATLSGSVAIPPGAIAVIHLKAFDTATAGSQLKLNPYFDWADTGGGHLTISDTGTDIIRTYTNNTGSTISNPWSFIFSNATGLTGDYVEIEEFSIELFENALTYVNVASEHWEEFTLSGNEWLSADYAGDMYGNGGTAVDDTDFFKLGEGDYQIKNVSGGVRYKFLDIPALEGARFKWSINFYELGGIGKCAFRVGTVNLINALSPIEASGYTVRVGGNNGMVQNNISTVGAENWVKFKDVSLRRALEIAS